ncbi:NUDIX domain-containing protein [Actinomadura terrae]|uniref:NUDIX domain-containing protein n=1 Tax=Actinomadura terrae TaxID=604353 RepID=UPI001FA6E842|nr:NUDIX domain-containing protein [Actinomadura terrae]
MARRSILIRDDEVTKDTGFVLICSGYLVERGRVLLVHHNRFGKWVPPGGHIEPAETFAETAVREFKEETGLLVEVLSAQPVIHPPDDNATPEPVPFYVDLEREGFRIPAIVQFFYVRRVGGEQEPRAQLEEVADADWFTFGDLADLPTFEQVRSLARFALRNYPIEGERA